MRRSTRGSSAEMRREHKGQGVRRAHRETAMKPNNPAEKKGRRPSRRERKRKKVKRKRKKSPSEKWCEVTRNEGNVEDNLQLFKGLG